MDVLIFAYFCHRTRRRPPDQTSRNLIPGIGRRECQTRTMKLQLFSLENLKLRLARAASQYLMLKEQAESGVVRWVWATDSVCSLRPGFDAKIHGFSEGKKLATQPARRAYHFQYGFDAAGRLVVQRLHGDMDGHFTEDFFVHSDDCVEQWSYGPRPQYKIPRGVSRYSYDGGRVVAYEELNTDGRTVVETYAYDGDRLATLARVGENPTFQNTFRHEYDAEGILSTITMETMTGTRSIVHKRPTRTPAVLIKAVRAHLLKLIPKCVAALSPAEPAFCLALVYEPSSSRSMLPPKLAVGLETERERWRAGGEPKESLWDAQGFATFDGRLALDDAALLADTREFSDLPSPDRVEKARKLLVNVARDLNKLNFGALIKVTPDFIVYPVDLHTEYLAQDMRAAVPPSSLKRLIARGEA